MDQWMFQLNSSWQYIKENISQISKHHIYYLFPMQLSFGFIDYIQIIYIKNTFFLKGE